MDAIYSLDGFANTGFAITVAYGSSGTVSSFVSCAFSPASGISSVQIDDITLWDNTRFSAVSTDAGSFPVTLINNDNGNSQIIRYNTIYNNNYLHATTIPVSGRFYVDMLPASLSAGSTDTLGYPYSASPTVSNGNTTIYVLTAVGDAASPSGVTSFAADIVRWSNSLALTWVNPTDADFTGCYIRGSTTSAPSSVSQGTLVTNAVAPATSYSDGGLVGATRYYYSIFAYDNVGKTSTAIVSASNIPYNSLPGSIYGETLLRTRSRLIDEGII